MPTWVCAGCEDTMPADRQQYAGVNGPVCEGCWDDEGSLQEPDQWFACAEPEYDTADLIGSQWYHEDLP